MIVEPVKIPVEKQLLNFVNYRQSFEEISRVIWQYFNYSGIFTPWHDERPVTYFPGFLKVLDKTIRKLVDYDVSLFSFGHLSLPLHKVDDWDRPTLLYFSNQHLSWTRKLRNYVDTRENLDYLAYFMLAYYQTQIHYFGKAFLGYGQVVKKDPDGYHYFGYEKLWDRILELTREGVDPILWMQNKVDRFVKVYPKEFMNFSCLTNKNGLEPDLDILRKKATDPWREIKEFLGLSVDCEIVDGYIPKGWQTSGDDFEDRLKIVKITGDGFYYYPKGTQRRGKRHYATNVYFGIKCTPENFGEFRDSWFDVSYLTKIPTWEEYKNWAIYPSMWDKDGNATNNRGRSVKWRKN